MINIDKTKIFVIMPFGKIGSDVYSENTHLYHNIIKPVLEEYSRYVKRADEFEHLGNINKDIIEHLFYSNIVIADLTGKNANVFYELGARHALRRNATIPIVRKGENIPFDISTYRTIFYDNSESGLKQLQDELRTKLVNVLNQSPLHIDNPVFDTLGNKINDLIKDNELILESRNIYENECERLRSEISKQNKKIETLKVKLAKLNNDIEKKEHSIKVYERNLTSANKTELYSKFLNVDENYWYNNILKSENIFVVLISANWIDDNKKIELQLTKISLQYNDYFILVRFNLDKIPKLAIKLEIKTIPRVIFVKSGEILGGFDGFQRDETYQGIFNRIYE